MEKIKICVIGVGHLGSIHARLWSKCEFAELIGVYDIIPERTLNIAKECNCTPFESFDQAIEFADAVTIAVPTSIHHEITEKCLNQNKHCFIEKPITDTVEQALYIKKIAEEKNLKIQVGHVERFNPVFNGLKDFTFNPLFIEAHRLGQFKPRANDVSVLHDLMIHDIDLVLWLVKSKIKTIDANGVNILTDNPDIANARITFENGSVANLTASRLTANPKRKMRIFQNNAYISLDFAENKLEVFQINENGSQPEGIPATMLGVIEAGKKNKNIFYSKPQIENINAIGEEQISFAKSILFNEPIRVTSEDGIKALEVVELILKQISK